MDKKSIRERELEKKLKALAPKIPKKYFAILVDFFSAYKREAQDFEKAIPTLLLFLELIEEQFRSTFFFEPYHEKIRSPVDYYRFGLDFIRPFIDMERSKVFGLEHLEWIARARERGENVVLLANHQTETDPQAIAILLEKTHPQIAESIIYVAGERVVTDPLAIPFSMGCNLLCIYSKRYIDSPPELKVEKQRHNQKTMEKMSRLLKEGGKIIYVAPSGGRDRKNERGDILVAPFDPNSIQMFYLMAKKAQTPTHFIPFALLTYDLLPPPESVQSELGERRFASRTPIFLTFAAPFEMERSQSGSGKSSHEERKIRAEAIWNIVYHNHEEMRKYL